MDSLSNGSLLETERWYKQEVIVFFNELAYRKEKAEREKRLRQLNGQK